MVDVGKAEEAVRAATRHAEDRRQEESAALAVAEDAAAAHVKAEAAVAAAYEVAREAALELEASRRHVCGADGCGQVFRNAEALQRHVVRAHRTSSARKRPWPGDHAETSRGRANERAQC